LEYYPVKLIFCKPGSPWHYNKIVEELLSKANPEELFGKDGLFQQLKKQIVERVLASELEHDLGYSKHSKAPKMDNNRRNGSYEKTIIDENGNCHCHCHCHCHCQLKRYRV